MKNLLKNYWYCDCILLFVYVIVLWLTYWIYRFVEPVYWFIRNELLWTDMVTRLSSDSALVWFSRTVAYNYIYLSVFFIIIILLSFFLEQRYKFIHNKFDKIQCFSLFIITILFCIPMIRLFCNVQWYVL